MNQGIHIIDLLLWFMGDPVEVHAFADSRHRSVEIEDTAGAVLRFANGAVATITATVAADPGFPHRLEVYGTNGGIQIEGESVLRWGLADESKATVEPWPVATEQVDPGHGRRSARHLDQRPHRHSQGLHRRHQPRGGPGY